MIRVEYLVVSYGLVQVLHEVNFTVEEGECVALLGSNGAGKTTTLKTISGLIRPRVGCISFLNDRIDGQGPSKIVESGVVHVPEGGKIFPYMSVTENLLMGASGRREAWPKRYKTLERVNTIFPRLKEREHLPARSLSGGERQMLVIGRGMMALPRLLMIDEPSLGLAPKTLSEIYDTLRVLRGEGVTILLSEQNAQQALRLADRGYVLENGRIVMMGPSSELLNSEHVKRAYLGI